MSANETFHGFIETTTDALLIFEACQRGMLPKVTRRLQDRERNSIRSGAVYVFDERESGIRRWTDGFIWSPSRILGNFLIYRELESRETLHQQRNKRQNNSSNNNNECQQRSSSAYTLSKYSSSAYREENISSSSNNNLNQLQCNEKEDTINNISTSHSEQALSSMLKEQNRYHRQHISKSNLNSRERCLIGSLTDTYRFKKDGLIKKTISIHINGTTQHLINYYTTSDVLDIVKELVTPSSIPKLSSLQIAPELILKQSFRVQPSVEYAEHQQFMIMKNRNGHKKKRPSLSPSSSSSTMSSSSSFSNLILNGPNSRKRFALGQYSSHEGYYQPRVNHNYDDAYLAIEHSRKLANFEPNGIENNNKPHIKSKIETITHMEDSRRRGSLGPYHSTAAHLTHQLTIPMDTNHNFHPLYYDEQDNKRLSNQNTLPYHHNFMSESSVRENPVSETGSSPQNNKSPSTIISYNNVLSTTATTTNDGNQHTAYNNALGALVHHHSTKDNDTSSNYYPLLQQQNKNNITLPLLPSPSSLEG
ncbi:Gti1/Pac2 family-domain-containing protein [Cokeromyces recurvatus]|uniref:Gti1/Pac2 family-domain-containing protein n=1 Tax=Cokeromyces recurvatus TaxID=90255 RepID=UPI00221FE1D8|nr:Gti1/Pac2 family-domain-containing protein [Cokeromyces recurvatus]KAI7907381.1 Gti1/Pac2 family-domain-containing protein [Cokeromyces recurvatus]